jgi:hypothetical protein
MSAATAWAWGQCAGDPAAKLVLLALAQHAQGGICWQTPHDLAQACELRELDVRCAFASLERRGLICRTVCSDARGRATLATELRIPRAAR